MKNKNYSEPYTCTAALTCCIIEGCFLASPRGRDLNMSNRAGLRLTPEVPGKLTCNRNEI